MALTIILLLLTASWFAGRALDRLFNRVAGYDTEPQPAITAINHVKNNESTSSAQPGQLATR